MLLSESFSNIRSQNQGASKSTDTNDDPVPTDPVQSFAIGELLAELKEAALSVQMYTRY